VFGHSSDQEVQADGVILESHTTSTTSKLRLLVGIKLGTGETVTFSEAIFEYAMAPAQGCSTR
jgi:hypothetical protein